MRRALLALLLLAAACGNRATTTASSPSATGAPTPEATESPAAQSPSPARSPSARPGATSAASATVLPTMPLRAGGNRITAEVADDPNERETGLMNRRSMPANNGMLFVFPGPLRGGFWMKDTLIPLSIAFMASYGDGWRIVDIIEMEPCPAQEQSCPIYTPDADYDAALEMNKEWFPRNGVTEGAGVTSEGPRPSAAA